MSPPLELLLTLGMLAAFVLPAWWWSSHQDRVQTADWGALAAQLGLSLKRAGRSMSIEGRIGDLEVRVLTETHGSSRNRNLYTVLRLGLGRPFPAGLSVGREGLGDAVIKLLGGQDIELGDPSLDRPLRIRGVDPIAVREAVSTPALQALLGLTQRHHHGSRLEEGQLIVQSEGLLLRPRLDRLIEEGVEVARQWQEALSEPWRELAARHGLHHRVEGSWHLLEGDVQGSALRVRLETRPGPGPRVRIRLSLPTPLPGGLGLRALPPGRGEPTGIGLRDPVLDGLLAATARDPDPARRLIHEADPQDELHGKLLAVLHAFPTSTVSEQAIHLNADSASTAAVGEQIEAVLALGAALERAAARLYRAG